MDPSPLNPERQLLTSLIRFDKRIVRAAGHFLYDEAGTAYLDFASQYGAVPFGYNPEFLWDRIAEIRQASEPSLVQPLRSPAAEALARRLVEVAPPGLRHVVFTSSGAECVEAAIKVARARTGRRTILATGTGFHGKTLGAASATGSPAYRDPFLADTTAFEHVPYDDLPRLEDRLACGDVAGFIVEPVQGEGGMVVPAPGYLAAARELCARHGTLFVLDEVQTGLGRTGKLFAAEWDGVAPDVLLVAKALGGGLVGLGACLVTGDAWSREFGLFHSSTFANNHLTCAVGLAVVERLLAGGGALLEHVRAMGEYLRSRMAALVQEYPNAFRSTSGRGLMRGLELAPWSAEDGYFLGTASRLGHAVPLVSGFLLNVHRIVALPTISEGGVLRVQPALTIEREHVDRLVDALADVGSLIEGGRFAQLIAYTVQTDAATARLPSSIRLAPRPDAVAISGAVAPGDCSATLSLASSGPHLGTFAFLMHPTQMGDMMDAMPSGCAAYPEEQRAALRAWVDRWRRFDPSPGAMYHLPRLPSKTSRGYVDGWLVGALLTPREMMRLSIADRARLMRDYFAVAAAKGATMIGLGAFTSVITRAGTEVPQTATPLTTGNSLTALSCALGLRRVARDVGVRMGACTVAVVGAAGSTGRLVALDIAPHCRRLTLFGNRESPKALRGLRAVAGEILRHLMDGEPEIEGEIRAVVRRLRSSLAERDPGPYDDAAHIALLERAEAVLGRDMPVVASTDPACDLATADVVVSATSSGKAFLRPEWFAPLAIVCDVARPADVCAEVAEARKDLVVYEGGLVTLPGHACFGRNNVLGFPAGVNLGCLSETIVLCMAQVKRSYSIGNRIAYTEAVEVMRLAQLHGFEPYAVPRFAGAVVPADACADEGGSEVA